MVIVQNPGVNTPIDISFSAIPNGLPGADFVVTGTLGEVEVSEASSTTTWNDYQIQIGTLVEHEVAVVTNLTPTICSTENLPIVEYVSNGTARLKVKVAHRSFYTSQSFSSTGGDVITKATDYSSGGHIEHAWDIIKPKLDASGAQIGHFSNLPSGGSWNTSILSATRNPSCWANGFDLSGIGFKSSKRAPLVTDRHVVVAAHYPVAVGDVLNFLKPDGTWESRTVIGTSPIDKVNPPFLQGDKQIAVLSSAPHATVNRYPVISDDWGLTCWLATFDGTTRLSTHFTGLWINQYHQIALAGNHSATAENYTAQECRYFTEAEETLGFISGVFGSGVSNFSHAGQWMDAYKTAWIKNTIGGDSGSPVFYPLNGTDLALVGTITSGGGGSGLADKSVIDMLIGYADADAIARGNLVSPTGLTVTVAPDPTL
jgi:hypothetical protein